MKHQIFPVEIIENSSEKLISRYSVTTYIIYNMIIFFVIAIFIASFIFKLDVNVTAKGLATPLGERVAIVSPYSALVSEIMYKENASIEKGDTILLLNSDQTEREKQQYLDRLSDVNRYISDLKILVRLSRNSIKTVNLSLMTSRFQKSLNSFISQYKDLEMKVGNASENFKRTAILLSEGVVSKYEFEIVKSEYDNLRSAVDVHYYRQIDDWQLELDKFIAEQRELNTQIEQLNIRKSVFAVISPVFGSIQKTEGIGVGSFVQQGQKLLEISLDGELYAECYVSPKDIGYIKIKQEVQMQIDAFNYNEWGVVSGSVIDIYDDVTLVDNQGVVTPCFKVVCKIDKPFLTLKNGYVGSLKKGMTLSCRFKVARRTLFQLLYDKASDWMNPNL